MGFDFIEATAHFRVNPGGGDGFDFAGTQLFEPPLDFLIPSALDFWADKIFDARHQSLGEFHALLGRESGRQFASLLFECNGHDRKMPESTALGKPVHFFNSAYSIESTSACKLASMMFSLTPTVPHSRLPSLEVMSTRVLAAVPVVPLMMRTL